MLPSWTPARETALDDDPFNDPFFDNAEVLQHVEEIERRFAQGKESERLLLKARVNLSLERAGVCPRVEPHEPPQEAALFSGGKPGQRIPLRSSTPPPRSGTRRTPLLNRTLLTRRDLEERLAVRTEPHEIIDLENSTSPDQPRLPPQKRRLKFVSPCLALAPSKPVQERNIREAHSPPRCQTPAAPIKATQENPPTNVDRARATGGISWELGRAQTPQMPAATGHQPIASPMEGGWEWEPCQFGCAATVLTPAPPPRRETRFTASVVDYDDDPAKAPRLPDTPVSIEGQRPCHRTETASVQLPPPLRHRVLPSKTERALKPHQKEGVAFVTSAMRGERMEDGPRGCLLADVPGMGKTMTVIASIFQCSYTLYRVLIVCPASLIANWATEFAEWAPLVRVDTFGAKSTDVGRVLRAFASSSAAKPYVLVASYEKVRCLGTRLDDSGIHVVVCDEAHRLKRPSTAEYKAVSSLSRRARASILVTGTPCQNSAEEFYWMISLALPGILGTLSSFRCKYAATMGATSKEQALCSMSSEFRAFMLRRGDDVMQPFLPSRVELVLSCKLSDAQAKLYAAHLEDWRSQAEDEGRGVKGLAIVQTLQKLCAHPALISPGSGASEDPFQSSKLVVLHALLSKIHATTEEKVLITSNYCYSLDLVEHLIRDASMPYVRIDGGVDVRARQRIIAEFSTASRAFAFVFLLSAKAGGAGLNITSCSRLVLFDPDWNPATDLQVCGRVWRTGQRQEVVIYRLVCTSTVEDLILSRQLAKREISNVLVDHMSASGAAMSREALERELAYVPSVHSRTFATAPASLNSTDVVLQACNLSDWLTHVQEVGHGDDKGGEA